MGPGCKPVNGPWLQAREWALAASRDLC